MARIPNGGCIITQQEMVDCPYSSQQSLKLLLEKGAPIQGCCTLCFDADYRWFCHDNPEDLSTSYSWEFKER